MASGNYAKKAGPRKPHDVSAKIPPRATRQLSEPETQCDDPSTEMGHLSSRHTISTVSKALQIARPTRPPATPLAIVKSPQIVATFKLHTLDRHTPWLRPLLLCTFCTVIFCAVLLSAGMFQRAGESQLVNYFGGKVYDVQVGGSLAGTWQSNDPLAPKVPIPSQKGPYTVLGNPSLSANFINQVLTSYHSPAEGKGQALYDMGVKYGIDPAFALAFFLHESTLGKEGEARSSLSLGNLRCIPNYRCQDNYAWFNTWEDGFHAWYELVRNLYVAQWGLTTVDQIIPKYAPNADHNDEAGYIASLKHYLDSWHAGVIMP